MNQCKLDIKLKWKNNEGIFDLFRDFESDNTTFTELPESITVDIPVPGKSTPIGWFRPNIYKIPETEIKLKL